MVHRKCSFSEILPENVSFCHTLWIVYMNTGINVGKSSLPRFARHWSLPVTLIHDDIVAFITHHCLLASSVTIE